MCQVRPENPQGYRVFTKETVSMRWVFGKGVVSPGCTSWVWKNYPPEEKQGESWRELCRRQEELGCSKQVGSRQG